MRQARWSEALADGPSAWDTALSQMPGAAAIPRATQERIVAAARRFNYRPNTLARSLRRQRSFTIGVLVPEISEGYATLVLRGIEDRLLQEGFLSRTPRGRQATRRAYEHLELPPPTRGGGGGQGRLF